MRYLELGLGLGLGLGLELGLELELGLGLGLGLERTTEGNESKPLGPTRTGPQFRGSTDLDSSHAATVRAHLRLDCVQSVNIIGECGR